MKRHTNARLHTNTHTHACKHRNSFKRASGLLSEHTGKKWSERKIMLKSNSTDSIKRAEKQGKVNRQPTMDNENGEHIMTEQESTGLLRQC